MIKGFGTCVSLWHNVIAGQPSWEYALAIRAMKIEEAVFNNLISVLLLLFFFFQDRILIWNCGRVENPALFTRLGYRLLPYSHRGKLSSSLLAAINIHWKKVCFNFIVILQSTGTKTVKCRSEIISTIYSVICRFGQFQYTDVLNTKMYITERM